MATVFMKWLEKNPQDYDRGIGILTLGQLHKIRKRIAADYIQQGTRVLEIGCGTGTLSVLMAESGGNVTAVDTSAAMLAVAQNKVISNHLQGRVKLKYLDATLLEEHFTPSSFDLIVSTLVFSELPLHQQRYVLESCIRLLAPEGRLLIADEVTPSHPLSRLFYYLIRWPLVLVTWLLTRTSTASLHNFGAVLRQTGFRSRVATACLGGSLVLFEGEPVDSDVREYRPYPSTVRQLRHEVTARTLLKDLWGVFFRILPPYPKVQQGLYAVGEPSPDSPVLVTGNFDLTVRRLVKELDGQVHAWVLVADSAGINVWCAAGGNYFTADKVIAAMKACRLEEVVRHHALILPQLCANGVDGWRVRRETGWGVHWGPVQARDLPAYLAGGRKKTDAMRWVSFPLTQRLEMVTVALGLYGLLILVPVLLFWRSLFWPVAISMLSLSYFYAVVHPWLPGRDGLIKSIPLALIALFGLASYLVFWDPLSAERAFNWGVGLTGLSVFSAAELQGMSPLMRGEQANWGWEAIIGLVLGLIYWLFPIVMGWSG